MINFKDTKDQTPSALAVLGIALLVGSLIFLLLFSRGLDTQVSKSKLRKDEIALTARSLMAKSDRSIYEDAIEKYQWKDNEDLVTPQALTIISKRAEENRLKLVSFRPMKSTETSSMVQLPLQFTVDGSFANVAAMLETLEKTSSRLAVSQVQFASQEGQSDIVSANVSIMAFLAKPVTKKLRSKTTIQSITTSTTSASAGTKTN
jgi:Tfp pilus assembly protein PilO